MFVFRPKDLPADPVYPADLKELGYEPPSYRIGIQVITRSSYFINDEDQIKKISDPDQDFQFKVNRNPRWNEVQREAMNSCIRDIVLSRIRKVGMTTLRLPLTITGPNEPHVPVLVSKNLSTASRIIVVFGEPIQDLGVWAYRSIGTVGINAGSAVSLADHILHQHQKGSPEEKTTADTALIIANTGQLVWHAAGRKAITMPSWLALPRRSAVDPPQTMTERNNIPGNENWQEHVECVFREILAGRGKLVRADAKIDIVGVAEGGLGAVRYLYDDWSAWSPYISSIAFCNPLHYKDIDLVGAIGDNPDEKTSKVSFRQFLLTRCRAYLLSPEPRGVPVPGIHEHGCNCFSSGEELNIEGIVPASWKEMVQWLEMVQADPEYREDVVNVRAI